MLVVTTTVGLGKGQVSMMALETQTESRQKVKLEAYMVDWVHRNTTGLGPGVTLDGELMLGS